MTGQKSEITGRPARGTSRRLGFTLIEMMVVIGIVLLLLALTVGVTAALTRKSEVRDTENMLKLMDMALTTWETSTERELTYGTPNVPPGAMYTLNATTFAGDPQGLQSAVLDTLMRTPAAKDILAQISGDRLKRDPDTGDYRIIDPWDQPVQILFPGRKWVSTDTVARDVDGTIRTTDSDSSMPDETQLGVCVNKRICFVSYGPDGKPGDADLGDPNPQPTAELADNLESYPLSREVGP